VKSVAIRGTGMVAVATLSALLGGCTSVPGATVASSPAPGLTSAGDPSATSGASVHTSSSVGATGSSKGGHVGQKSLGGEGGIGGVGGRGNNLGGASGTGPGYHDSRITLPETINLSFSHPQQTDRTEHEVLSTVQQALRAQLHSENNPSGSTPDPLLSMYWTPPALTAAQSELATWLKKGKQAVGVLVITDTAYTAPGTSGKSVVTYCANWSDKLADKANARATRGAVQPSSTPQSSGTGTSTNTSTSTRASVISRAGSYTTLTLVRADKHHWQVQGLVASPDSPNCSNTTDPPSEDNN
jgi:hypothetical protein